MILSANIGMVTPLLRAFVFNGSRTFPKLGPKACCNTTSLKYFGLRSPPTSISLFADSHSSSITSTLSSKIIVNSFHKSSEHSKINRSKQKILTVPNILTLTRLATTPLVGYMILNGMYDYALYYFAASALTDALDGQIARTFPSQATKLGAILDPVADKALLMTCFFSLFYVDLIPFYMAKAVIFRDVLILVVGGGARYFGFSERPTIKKYFDFERYPTKNLHPSKLSKINTSLQCSLVVATLWSTMAADPLIWATPLTFLQCITFTTTFATLFQYALRMNRDIFTVKL